MIKKRIIIDILIVSALGTLLHFVYDWSGQNNVVAIFSSVNESTWEHLKLLFWPVFLLTAVEFFLFKRQGSGFWASRLVGLLLGMLTIVTLYYTITGIIGRNIAPINITIFYIGVIITFLISAILQKNGCFKQQFSGIIAFALFLLLAYLFAVWSFNPPAIGIFADPQI